MSLELLEWRRRVTTHYADARRDSALDPIAALARFRAAKDDLFARHPQTPIALGNRATFRGLDYWSYHPALRFDAIVQPTDASLAGGSGPDDAVPWSSGSAMPLRAVGVVELPFGSLTVYWIDVYGGGIFVPFRDLTSGVASYGGGRYLLDTVKGADLGGDGDRLVIDFNYAYHPSCSYDARWSCPLAPPTNTLPVAIEAGERMLSDLASDR
jgi:uncharacterized protein